MDTAPPPGDGQPHPDRGRSGENAGEDAEGKAGENAEENAQDKVREPGWESVWRGALRRAVPLIQRVSSHPAFAVVAPHVLPVLDRAMARLTGGRVLLGAPVLSSALLTTVGARSGRRRQTPLAAMPGPDGTFVLVGSNFGRPGHPAWSANLLRHPQARINVRGRDIPVTATLLRGAERQAVWAELLRFWPPYATYAARVDRELRVFRLTPR